MRMHDQSFGERALERMLKKGDFRGIPAIDQNEFRSSNLAAAKAGAHTSFDKPANPLGAFELKKKTIYTLPKLSDELVVRKLCDNLRPLITSRNRGRAAIVANLGLLLEEGTPYRIYRLDVKSFYESFDVNGVCEKVKGLAELSPMSKTLITSLLASHVAIGGHGIPRGLALSASLSDLMMQDFDNIMISHKHVFFYARYVDDIIIITSAIELKSNFQQEIETTLPSNLKPESVTS